MDNEEQKTLRLTRRIIREFSEQFGKNIEFQQDQVIFKDLGLKTSLNKLIEKTEGFQEELLEDALPLVLFHMYEDLVKKQALNFLLRKEPVAEFENNILTYRPLSSNNEVCLSNNVEEQHEFGWEFPLIIRKEGLCWVLGVQCGNKKRESLAITGHKFIPLTVFDLNTEITNNLKDLFLASARNWNTVAYVGELGKNTGLYYVFGDRIADFLITQELFDKVKQKTEIEHIDSYTVISRHFVIFSTQKNSISRLNEISDVLHNAAEEDNYLQQVFGVKEKEDLIGKFHTAALVESLPSFKIEFNITIKIDYTGGELLAVL